jgi:hypothetical protein
LATFEHLAEQIIIGCERDQHFTEVDWRNVQQAVAAAGNTLDRNTDLFVIS